MYTVNKIHTRFAMKKIFHQALVAHACNPSYSGGRDQEDCSWKPTWANSSGEPSLKNHSQKKKVRLVEWLKVKAQSSIPSTEEKLLNNAKGNQKRF
jgi:hypothetical protein